ncbi:MAG: signal peptidase I [Bacilli bacterium]|nr:signal peptidase I [Bacilli bacterium]
MKKIEIYFIELLLFISIIVFNILYKNYYLFGLSVILIGIYFIYKYGLMKDNNYAKSNVTKIVISCLLSYFVTIYLLGILLGFNKTVLSFTPSYFFRVVLLDAILIVFEELIRYIICRNTQHKKLPVIIYSIILIILNIIIEISGFNLSDNEMVFIFISTVIIPVIARELLCSYLTYKVSYVPSLIFKLTMCLYELVLPIIPSLGNYLYAVANTALPYIIYFFVSKLLHYKTKANDYRKKTIREIALIPTAVLLIILVILVSGVFSHTIIAIGSKSMLPTYGRGDAVIYKKIEPNKVRKGQIIAFKKSGRIITHRVIYIQKQDSKYIYKTKGDANNAPDTYQVDETELLGIVTNSIKFVGYPTLWFNDLYTGKETS